MINYTNFLIAQNIGDIIIESMIVIIATCEHKITKSESTKCLE